METPNTTLMEFSNGAVATLTEFNESDPVRAEIRIGDHFLMWEVIRITGSINKPK